MFSLALKNAILLILIIMILHILIKNYLINFQKTATYVYETPVYEELQVAPPPPPIASKNVEEIKQDENELYSFLFNKQVPASVPMQPQPQQGALLSSMPVELGTISKFGDYAMV